MQGLRQLLLLGACALCLAAPAFARTGSPAVGGACSKQTAQQLEADTVASVLCGAFAGPDSQAMVVRLTNGTCLPFLSWDVFMQKGGAWTKLPLTGHGGFSGYPVTAVGTDLKET